MGPLIGIGSPCWRGGVTGDFIKVWGELRGTDGVGCRALGQPVRGLYVVEGRLPLGFGEVAAAMDLVEAQPCLGSSQVVKNPSPSMQEM